MDMNTKAEIIAEFERLGALVLGGNDGYPIDLPIRVYLKTACVAITTADTDPYAFWASNWAAAGGKFATIKTLADARGLIESMTEHSTDADLIEDLKGRYPNTSQIC